MPLREWEAKKSDIRSILSARALQIEATPLTYTQLCDQMTSPPVGPTPQNSYELAALLDEVDREEAAFGHGMLTSLVFREDERNRQPFLPGKGFYSLAKKLGHVFENTEAGKLQFALEQIRRVSVEQRHLQRGRN